jgi:hypothetical protein
MKASKHTMSLLLLLGATALAGCGRAPKREVDYTYDQLIRSSTGNVATSIHGSVWHTAPGDGRGGIVERTFWPNNIPDQMKSSDGFGLCVFGATETTAVIRVTFQDGTQTNLALVPNVPREEFEARGSNGLRIVVDEIRVRK